MLDKKHRPVNEHILTLQKAENFVNYAEIYRIFWRDWDIITEVEYDALAHLVKHSYSIHLPNVKSLSADKIELLKGYKGRLILGFDLPRDAE